MNARLHALIVLTLFLLACWQRQDHAITGPEWPYYTLSGYTVDLDDTTQVLPHTPVSLQATLMLYDVIFDPVTVRSDSGGYFQIDSVFPGNYLLTADRDGYAVVKDNLTIKHTDRLYDIHLPEPLLNAFSTSALYSSDPKFAWVNNELWRLGQTRSLRIRDGTIPIVRRYTIEYKAGALKLKSSDYDYLRAPFFAPTALQVIGNMFYWHSDGLIILCDRESQTIFDFSILDSFRVQDPLYDLIWDGHGFWTTQGPFLQYRGSDLKTVEAWYETDVEVLGPLAYSAGHFWSYDEYRGLVLKLDDRGNILANYRPIDGETGSWIAVHDMDMDSFSRLWASDRRAGKIYVFNVR